MKIVVFGGSGFLGSHVADVLTDKGYEVIIYDLNESPYLKENQKMIVGDILDQKKVEKAIKNCDVVYNFAGIADMDEAKIHPLKTVKNNVLGNTILLEASWKSKIKRFVFASSLYVFSQAGSFYRSSKQACELIIENYQKVYGLDYTVLRYGSLYGDRANKENWIFQILKDAITKGKIVRYGDGEEIREYIHVKDAARLSVEILEKKYKNQYILITGQQQTRIKDLLTMIREIMGNRITIEYRSVDDKRCPYDTELHYNITPYSFYPKIGKRLFCQDYTDLGQGIFDSINKIYKDYGSSIKEESILSGKRRRKKK